MNIPQRFAAVMTLGMSALANGQSTSLYVLEQPDCCQGKS